MFERAAGAPCTHPCLSSRVCLQPIQILNSTIDMVKPGKFPSGKTEIPFEFPLHVKGNKVLYETYHGVFVNIQVSAGTCRHAALQLCAIRAGTGTWLLALPCVPQAAQDVSRGTCLLQEWRSYSLLFNSLCCFSRGRATGVAWQ